MSAGFFSDKSAVVARPDDALDKTIQTLRSNAEVAQRLNVNKVYVDALKKGFETVVNIRNEMEGNVVKPQGPTT